MTAPLKVLHVHSGNLFGGIESMLVTLDRYGSAAGLENRFALCFDARLRASLPESSVTLLGSVRMSRPWTWLAPRLRLRTLLKRSGTEVVVFHSPWAQGIFGPTVRARVPIARWFHGAPPPTDRLERIARRGAASLNIANSEFTLEAVRQIHPSAIIRVLHPPVPGPPPADPEKRISVRRSLGVDPEVVVMLQLARLEPGKGQRRLIDALAEMDVSTPWMSWIGGGVQRPEDQVHLEQLRAAVAQYGLESRVRFLGERKDVRDLYAAADIYCQPNGAPEPFGLTFIEALYAGLPVVTTRMGGPLEIVTDQCGLLVAPGDRSALVEALRALVSDMEARQRLGAAGPRRAQALCDAAQQTARFAEMLHSVARA